MAQYEQTIIKALKTDNFDVANQFIDFEIKNIRSRGEGCSRTVHAICYLLCKEGKKDNMWKIWEAKSLNMDTNCSINVYWLYLFFDTVSEFREFVKKAEHPLKQTLLRRIDNDTSTWMSETKFKEIKQMGVGHVDVHKIHESFIKYG